MMSKYQRILVAVDGLSMTKKVMETAIEVCHHDTEVYLVNVVDYPGTLGAINEDAIITKDEANAKQLIEDLVDDYPALIEKAKQVIPRVIVGNPHEVIAKDLPKDFDIDLIIMGKTSHHSLLDKIFVGSTAKEVLAAAPCDVLLVKK